MSEGREALAEAVSEALKAALTSWPRVVFVRMERRWRGLNVEGLGVAMLEEASLAGLE